jgi:Na+-driven multidrug efflux pump
LDETIKVALKWSTMFCVVFSLLLLIIPQTIISLFSKNDATLIDIGVRALRANGITFFLFGFLTVFMELFLAMGKAEKAGCLVSAARGCFLFLLS